MKRRETIEMLATLLAACMPFANLPPVAAQTATLSTVSESTATLFIQLSQSTCGFPEYASAVGGNFTNAVVLGIDSNVFVGIPADVNNPNSSFYIALFDGTTQAPLGSLTYYYSKTNSDTYFTIAQNGVLFAIATMDSNGAITGGTVYAGQSIIDVTGQNFTSQGLQYVTTVKSDIAQGAPNNGFLECVNSCLAGLGLVNTINSLIGLLSIYFSPKFAALIVALCILIIVLSLWYCINTCADPGTGIYPFVTV
ncbi:hypothetical protein [Gloeobacter kilaueensis]|uniref:Uncharacterized protein n=1 Tax=Gloeobacter kilaueensis (strain ATCC BAA-2537 / CCAP 1431/1 / ULC 316 / JS1) TaxID=1183438 RepID=U5QFM7_GLOK1|nr:hypothetical protein [Gloeobacter kilaueensis]AGY57772.1 hypothetical protein GKIL_1526 [Gloeobacter kilaueensis JS1]